MENEKNSDFTAAMIKVEEPLLDESVRNRTHQRSFQEVFEASSVISGTTAEEKVNPSKQSTILHPDAFLKSEKHEKDRPITNELVGQLSYDVGKFESDSKELLRIVKHEKNEISLVDKLHSKFSDDFSHGLGKFESDSKSLLRVVKQEKHENSFEDESQSKCNHSPNIGDSTFGGEDIDNEFSEASEIKYKTPPISSHEKLENIAPEHLKEHLPLHSSKKRFECAQCSVKFIRKDSLRIHLTTHWDEKPFSCPLCLSTFSLQYYLKIHLITETRCSEKVYSCAHCSMKFKEKSHIARHAVTHLDEQQHSCPHCPEVFKHENDLKRHSEAHASQKSLLRAHCSVESREKSNVACHMVTFTNRMQLWCRRCSKAFKHKIQFRKHLKTHKLYSCPQCFRKFLQRQSLKAHQTTHSNKKGVAVNDGPAKVQNDRGLRQRDKTCSGMNVHGTEKKLHKRNQGHIKAQDVNQMKQHDFLSSNEKPFSCDRCPAKFKTSGNLKSHAIVHTDEKPFICVGCSKKYKSNRSLKRHLSICACRNL